MKILVSFAVLALCGCVYTPSASSGTSQRFTSTSALGIGLDTYTGRACKTFPKSFDEQAPRVGPLAMVAIPDGTPYCEDIARSK